MKGPRIIVAMDVSDIAAMQRYVEYLSPQYCRIKVGKELFTACGPNAVEWLQKKGFEVFLDLKFHDIPHTVGRACHNAAALGVWMLNVHALGGQAMIEAAKEAIVSFAKPPLLIAVTILTSSDNTTIEAVGLQAPISERVSDLARLACNAGADGVVLSALETPRIKMEQGVDFLCVTPGIRLAGDAISDQKRVLTPQEAIAAGADYLVMGRSILEAKDPEGVLKGIIKSYASFEGSE